MRRARALGGAPDGLDKYHFSRLYGLHQRVPEEDGEKLGLRMHSELSEDGSEMVPNGARAEIQSRSDFLNALAFDEPSKDLPLPSGKGIHGHVGPKMVHSIQAIAVARGDLSVTLRGLVGAKMRDRRER